MLVKNVNCGQTRLSILPVPESWQNNNKLKVKGAKQTVVHMAQSLATLDNFYSQIVGRPPPKIASNLFPLKQTMFEIWLKLSFQLKIMNSDSPLLSILF